MGVAELVSEAAGPTEGSCTPSAGSALPSLGGRLLRTLATHDPASAEHSSRTVPIARAVGRRLGLEPDALTELVTAALLHDIGKLLVPAQTLNRRGPLGRRDRYMIERHPGFGARLLAGSAELAGVARIVHQHHERPDGRGYPSGASGSEVCLSARIVGVCDAFEAMTSDRPYRAAMRTSEALDELRRGTGTQFDPVCAETVIEVVSASHPRRGWQATRPPAALHRRPQP